MTPEQIDRVFGRGRLKMVTGGHVEVFREAVAVGERRRYTKRFLNTQEGDFGQWTEREWRILARLIGHGIACVPDVVQFDRGRLGGTQLVQTYDAGVTVDQWATLLPVTRDGHVYRHVFEDCAHWWALAHHCLCALDVIHPLELVHLDIKGDNVCIPYAPASFDPDSSDLRLQPIFAQLSLIDFAFALISRESLTTPLPIGWQKEYDYQSPRLLAALEAGRNGDLKRTRELDWRCDMYSLAAMLKRSLPDTGQVPQATGWTAERYDAAKALILRLREAHDSELPSVRPHAALLALTGARLREIELTLSLARGWTLMREANVVPASASPLTPVTRVAPVTRLATPVHVVRSGRVTAVTVVAGPAAAPAASAARPRLARGPIAALTTLVAFAAVATALWYSGDRAGNGGSDLRAFGDALRAAVDPAADRTQPSALGGDDTREAAASDRDPSIKLAAAGRSPAAMAPPSPPQAADPRSPALAARPAQKANGAETLQPAGASVPAAPATPEPKPNGLPAIGAPLPETPPSLATSSAPASGPAISSFPVEARAAASLQSAPPPAAAPVPRKSPAAAPVTASRTVDESSSVSSSNPAAASRAAENRAPTPARKHASWASLEPPAWLRTGNPPNPPGATTQESRPGRVAAAEPARAETAPGADPSRPQPAAAAATPPSDAPSTTSGAAIAPAPTPARKHAWWASLEPPAWLRTGNPPDPPGATTQESRPDRVATAELARTETTPAADPRRPKPAATAATPSSEAPSTTHGAPPAPRPSVDGMPESAPIAERGVGSTFAQAAVAPRIDDDFAAQGRRMLAEHVPRIALRAEPEVARVLGWRRARISRYRSAPLPTPRASRGGGTMRCWSCARRRPPKRAA